MAQVQNTLCPGHSYVCHIARFSRLQQTLPVWSSARPMLAQTDAGADSCGRRQLRAQTDACTDRQRQTQADRCGHRQDTVVQLLVSVKQAIVPHSDSDTCPLARSLTRLACIQCTHSSEVRWSCGCFAVTSCHIIQAAGNTRRLACCRSTPEEAFGR